MPPLFFPSVLLAAIISQTGGVACGLCSVASGVYANCDGCAVTVITP